MDFASFAARTHAFDLTPLTGEQLKKLSRLFDRGTPFPELLSRYARELGDHPPETWRRAREVWSLYIAWRGSVRATSSERLEAGLQLLPDEAIRRTWSEDGLALLQEAAERLPLEAFQSHAAWHDALATVAAGFQDAMAALLREGRVRVEGEVPHGDTPEGAITPLSMSPTDWLLVRSAEADGAAKLALEAPEEAMETALGARAEILDRDAEGLDGGAILRELVRRHLDPAARRDLDRRAVIETIAVGCERYRRRLEAAPLRAERAGAVFLDEPDTAAGVIVVTREGRVEAEDLLPSDRGGQGVADWLADRLAEGDAVVVPSRAEDDQRLCAIREALAGHELYDVPPDALGAPKGRARRPPEIHAAMGLARRAFEPRRCWASIPSRDLALLDPGVRLTGADAERFDERLADIAASVAPSAPAARDEARPEPKRKQARTRSKPKKPPEMNPGIKTLRDLEPDMKLRGKVTNVNRFGAFVDVGIAKEGLVPIRTLTDGFADSPDSVVRRGQTARVRVVGVDGRRRRFELALEHVDEGGGGSNGRGGGGGRRGGGRSRGGRRRGR